MSTTYTGVDPRLMAQLAGDVRQLTEPIHIAVRGRILTHPALLDQLRAATEPGAAPQRGRLQRRRIADSRVPVNLGAADALSTLYVELGGWQARLRLPSPPRYLFGCEHASCCEIVLPRSGALGPPCRRASVRLIDYQKAALRQFVGAAPNLAPAIAEWLALDVRAWWRLAAVESGWRIDELMRVR